MKNFPGITKLAAIGLSAVLSACAGTPMNQAMPPDLLAGDKTTQVLSAVSQSEMQAHIAVQDSSALAGQFGLIGALVGAAIDSGVNSSRTEAANERLAAIRDALIDFDFTQYYFDHLHANVDNAALGAVVFSRASEFTDAYYYRRTQDPGVQYTLFLNGDYYLSADFSAIQVGIRALLVDNATIADRKGKSGRPPQLEIADAAYRSTILAEFVLDAHQTDDPAANATRWAEQGATLARTALERGVVLATEVLEMDLTGPDYAQLATELNETRPIAGLPSQAVARLANATVFKRTTDGALWVVPDERLSLADSN